MRRLIAPTLCILLLFSTLSAQRTKFVIIAVLDGARYSETAGDSSHQFIPRIWNELRPQGALYTACYNNGKTETNPGHCAVITGTWQNILNEGSQRPYSPTIFEYYRKEKNTPAADCWVALGKEKLNILSYSTHAAYGSAYGASVKTSADVNNDILAYNNARSALIQNHSRLTIVNFAKIDIDGHANNWENYTASIKRADTLAASLWKTVQEDSLLKNKTTMIVTNDHGRHSTSFSSHGDGCDGCRHIMLLILGPDTPKDIVDSSLYSQTDITPTIGSMMRFSTPLSAGSVIQSAVAARINVPVEFKSPPESKVNGTIRLQWKTAPSKDILTTVAEYSADAGGSWKPLFTATQNDSAFGWNTASVSDGTRYLLRVQVFGDTSYGIAQLSKTFTIDNPGNGVPDIVLLSPNRNIIVSGTEPIRWSAADAEGDLLRLSIEGSNDSGSTWQTIESGLTNTGLYEWNSKSSANSKAFKLKIVCSDGTASSSSSSPLFEVKNERKNVGSIRQTAGPGNGIVMVNIIDPLLLNGNAYIVFIHDSTGEQKHYSVFDKSKNIFVLHSIPFIGDGSSEGPQFDGIRLAVLDYTEPEHNPDSTGWIKGSSTLTANVFVPEIQMPDSLIYGTPEAADYEIRISADIADTSKGDFGAIPTPVFFTVQNITDKIKVPFLLSELTPDGKISFGDDLFLLTKDSANTTRFTWEIFVTGKDTNINPVPGDVFRISTFKPLSHHDVFEFSAAATEVRLNSRIPGIFSLEQNYPNPFNPATTIRFTLPFECFVTIAVYDMLGREVTSFVKEKLSKGAYDRIWNAGSVSTGIYFCRMTAVRTGGMNSVLYSEVKKLVLVK